jgi:hypothetical protein
VDLLATIIPFAIGSGTASGLSIRLIPRFGKRILLIGAALAAIGVAVTIYSIHVIGTDLHSWQLIPAMFIGGVGLGMLIAPSLNFVLAGIGGKDVGSASGVLTTVQQIGGAIGVAAIGVIFFGQLATHADTVSANQVPQIRQQLSAGNLPADVVDHIVASYMVCFHDRSGAKDPTIEPDSCKQVRQYRPVLPPSAGVGQMTPAQRSAAIAAEYQHVGERPPLAFTVGTWPTLPVPRRVGAPATAVMTLATGSPMVATPIAAVLVPLLSPS